MKKNLVVYGLLMLLMASNTCFGFAQSRGIENENANIEVIDLSGTLTEAQVFELKDTVSASVVSEDGTQVPLDVVLEVKELTNQRSANGDKTYSIKASTQKTESDSGNKDSDGVTARANFEMVWTDVKGPKNVINSLSGNVSITKGTHNSSKVEWGYSDFDIVGRETVGTSFNTKPNYTTTHALGKVHACYIIKFKETTKYLQVCVTPSVFD